jgi:hypothetical protein
VADLKILFTACALPPTVTLLEKTSNVVRRAFQNLKQSWDTVVLIAPGKSLLWSPLSVIGITKNLFALFCKKIKVIVPSPLLTSQIKRFDTETIALDGLSAYDGTIAYVNSTNSRKATVTTLEHELMHCLPRWLNSQKGQVQPRLISPEKNRNLRSKTNGAMIEAGDFFEEQVYDRVVQDPSPFCLTVWRKRLTF